MIFKLHYWFLTSGACASGILMGVFIETYTDASALEIGTLFMIMPFTSIIFRPLVCSLADRQQAHRKYLMLCLLLVAVSYMPFIIIPYLGPSIYEAHPRFCWYFLFALKVFGDTGFGGVISIGDSLAINYANRIGTDYSVYRVWGTLGWMCFGMIIGQINEVSFVPKYTPGFMILICSNLLDMLVIWLWPNEYFTMVSKEQAAKEREEMEKKLEGKKLNQFTKSLLPKEVVLAHMRDKILSLFGCSTGGNKEVTQSNITNKGIDGGGKVDLTVDKTTGDQAVVKKFESSGERTTINKRTQFQILALLLKRDIRIFLYLMFFVIAGICAYPISFFFIQLSNICHTQGTCPFSQLAGMLQASMAAAETVLFIYVKQIKDTIGRVNTCALSLFMISAKYLFYGTAFSSMSPYYSLVGELFQGFAYGIFLTLMVECAHEFAQEVEHILPELMDKGIVSEGSDCESLKISLSATMQALISNAMDGLGRGMGAMVFGVIIDKYSYETLWLMIGGLAGVCCLITVVINLADRVFGLDVGLNVAERKKLPSLTLSQMEKANGSPASTLSRPM